MKAFSVMASTAGIESTAKRTSLVSSSTSTTSKESRKAAILPAHKEPPAYIFVSDRESSTKKAKHDVFSG